MVVTARLAVVVVVYGGTTTRTVVHQDGGVKHAIGASSKIREKDDITIGTWNTRTLRAAGKL